MKVVLCLIYPFLSVKDLDKSLLYATNLHLMFSAVKCLSGATTKYDLIGKAKVFLSHTHDLVFLITGLNIKSIFTRSKEQEPESSCDGDKGPIVMPTTPEEAVTHLLRHEEKPFK